MSGGEDTLARRVGALLEASGLWLATAESCTGGWIAQRVTSVAGSSRWFDRGFVTYSNAAKQQMLAVPEELIETHGAVSEAVVRAMAAGAIANSAAQVAVSVSGVAGPGGGSAEKPVGTVWLAWQGPDGACTQHRLYAGDREAVRHAAAQDALCGLLSLPVLAQTHD